MFRLIHWLTCKHKDVHRLRQPLSLGFLQAPSPLNQGRLVRLLRRLRLDIEVHRELKDLSVPTPGPKDV
ncbi:hypothetical protein LCGC14_0942150, partial [marine sediment metagenome]